MIYFFFQERWETQVDFYLDVVSTTGKYIQHHLLTYMKLFAQFITKPFFYTVDISSCFYKTKFSSSLYQLIWFTHKILKNILKT